MALGVRVPLRWLGFRMGSMLPDELVVILVLLCCWMISFIFGFSKTYFLDLDYCQYWMYSLDSWSWFICNSISL